MGENALKKYWIWNLLCALFYVGHAQPANPIKTQNFEVRFLGISDGLSSRNINQIFEDQRGMIWAATERGLDVFDGQRFQPFKSVMPELPQLPGQIVHHICEDVQQRLWVRTSGGMIVIDQSRKNLVPLSAIGIPPAISAKPNFSFTQNPKGGLWLFAGNTLYSYRIIKNKPVLKEIARNPFNSTYVPDIVGSIRGDCWILDKIHGLSTLKGKRFEKVRSIEFPYPQYLYPKVTATNHLGDSLTIFRNFQYELFQIRKTQEGYTAALQPYNLQSVDPKWASILDFLEAQPAIAGGNLITPSWISKDRTGAYWFATNIGIFLIRARTGLNFKQVEAVKKNSVRGIWGDAKGLRWIGAYSGAFFFPDNRPARFFPQIKATWEFFHESPGVFWLARENENSPSRIHFQNDQLFIDSITPLGFMLRLCPYGENLLAGGNGAAVAVLKRPSGKLLYAIDLEIRDKAFEMVLPAVKAILVGKDSCVWVGGNAGLFRLVKGQNQKLRQDKAAIPKVFENQLINTLYLDKKGNLWIGTTGQGLWCFNPQTRKVKHYLAVDGLAHDIVYSILGSHSDSLLWIGTQKGLSCLNVPAESFYNYYAEDGIADNEFNTSATWKAPDGTLYMGGINGVTYFKPKIPVLNESNAGVFICLDILDLRKSGKQVRSFPISEDTLDLYSSNQYLDIRFQSNAHFDSEELIYRFRISNRNNTAWQYLRSGEKLILNHLPTGMNQLVAQARTPAGSWGPPYRLFFFMHPPWYSTWQFSGLLIAAFLGIVYYLVRLRLNKYQREYDLRKKISADLHDEFGGRLYALNVLANQINAPTTSGADFPKLFEQFQHLSMETLRTARNFIWAFDPGSDRLANLADRMEDFCTSVIRPIVPNLKFQRDHLPYNKPINSKTKHYTLMIFQELLTNMVKHSYSESIYIKLYVKERYLVVKISNLYRQDKHKPLPGQHSGGSGLVNINSRLNALNANIERKDNGHTYEVTLTIQKW